MWRRTSWISWDWEIAERVWGRKLEHSDATKLISQNLLTRLDKALKGNKNMGISKFYCGRFRGFFLDPGRHGQSQNVTVQNSYNQQHTWFASASAISWKKSCYNTLQEHILELFFHKKWKKINRDIWEMLWMMAPTDECPWWQPVPGAFISFLDPKSWNSTQISVWIGKHPYSSTNAVSCESDHERPSMFFS